MESAAEVEGLRWDWSKFGSNIKNGLSLVSIERIFSVPTLAFSAASLLVPGCWLHAVSFAKLLWLESEEILPERSTLPLTEDVQAPGTLCYRWRMGCGTRNPPSPFLQTEPLRNFSPKLGQVLKHAECILHLSKKCGMIYRIYKCYKSKWTLFISRL